MPTFLQKILPSEGHYCIVGLKDGENPKQSFHDDWISGKIDKDKVMIVHFDRMMNDFDGLMQDIIHFIEIEPSADLKSDIKMTAEKQRSFKSKHKYDLSKFGLTEQQIKDDCKVIYETFLSDNEVN